MALYVVLPLLAGVATRCFLARHTLSGEDAIRTFASRIKPWSIFGLLATVVLLFGFQAQTIMSQPLAIVLIAIPLLIQTYGIFALSYFAGCKLKLPRRA